MFDALTYTELSSLAAKMGSASDKFHEEAMELAACPAATRNWLYGDDVLERAVAAEQETEWLRIEIGTLAVQARQRLTA